MIPHKTTIQESKTFCMYPWIHLHTSPSGVAAPCCVSKSCSTANGVGNSNSQSLMELVNSDKMKELRLDMINGVKNSECDTCYRLEDQQYHHTHWTPSSSLAIQSMFNQNHYKDDIMQKIFLSILIGFNLVLAGVCIAAGLLNHIDAGESLILTSVSFALAAFAAIEFKSLEDN